jgi:hypothetical protein
LAVDFLAVDFLAVAFFRVDFLAAGIIHLLPRRSGRHALQASPLPLAHPAPHAVALVAT